jgi:2-polyprenyl-3-methyl-5-hydroxy-6-metoxy-1,4-benzoquinol methylase
MSDDPQMALVNRLFEASLGAGEVFTVYLGDHLGFYRILLDGDRTASELASAAETDDRATREWLEQQAAAGILSVDDVTAPAESRRFSLPREHAAALTDPDSAYSIAPLCRSFAAIGATMPRIAEAFRTGKGVSADDYGLDMMEAQGDFNRPWLRSSLGTEYLPSIPDVHERLSAGATVADVACGVGWAGISIAQAYPNVTVDGFDLSEPAITLARVNAAEAGVADRVNFSAEDVGGLLLDNVYDLAIVVEAIHDLSAPVDVLTSIREMLAEDGTLIVADEKTEDVFTAPASETERFFYAYSVLDCLLGAQVDDPTAATGTVMRRSTFETYAKQAGSPP